MQAMTRAGPKGSSLVVLSLLVNSCTGNQIRVDGLMQASGRNQIWFEPRTGGDVSAELATGNGLLPVRES